MLERHLHWLFESFAVGGTGSTEKNRGIDIERMLKEHGIQRLHRCFALLLLRRNFWVLYGYYICRWSRYIRDPSFLIPNSDTDRVHGFAPDRSTDLCNTHIWRSYPEERTIGHFSFSLRGAIYQQI